MAVSPGRAEIGATFYEVFIDIEELQEILRRSLFGCHLLYDEPNSILNGALPFEENCEPSGKRVLVTCLLQVVDQRPQVGELIGLRVQGFQFAAAILSLVGLDPEFNTPGGS